MDNTTRFEKLEREIAELSRKSAERIEKLERENAELRRKSAERIEKLERENAELRRKSAERIEKLERENAELIRKSAERIEKLERENADLRNQLARKLCREAGCVIASSQDECSICMETNVEVAIQSCKHTFHALCLSKWINQRHGTCPNCRGCLQPSLPKTT